MNLRVGRAAAAVVLAVSWSCTGGDDGEGSRESVIPSAPRSVATTAESTTPPTTVAPGPPQPPPPDPDCTPAPDRKVTPIPDATVAAIVGEAIDVPAIDLGGGNTVPAVHVPGFTVPAQTFDGGCIIEHVAPGGCLGAIEMTSVTLPEVTLPGFDIEAVELDGEQVAERIARPPVVIAAASAPAVRLEQDCEVAPTGDGAALALIREELVRRAAVRVEGLRQGVRRAPVCVDDQCSAELTIDRVVVPQASISEVVIPELVVLVQPVPDAPDAHVVEVPGQTSYTAPVDVLFDAEAAALRLDAAPSLQAIAAEVRQASPESSVVVEGHTDSDGETAYNEDLSRRRAESVTAWLVAEGGIPAERITTVGLGESVPVAPNDTPEGRARNRRVVISVLEV